MTDPFERGTAFGTLTLIVVLLAWGAQPSAPPQQAQMTEGRAAPIVIVTPTPALALPVEQPVPACAPVTGPGTAVPQVELASAPQPAPNTPAAPITVPGEVGVKENVKAPPASFDRTSSRANLKTPPGGPPSTAHK